MKICWNNLENIKLTKNCNFRNVVKKRRDICVTLCKICHIKVHKQPGCGYQDHKCNKEIIKL